MKKVLVTGTEGGASQSIIKCLRMARGYKIITTGIDPLSIGVYRGDKGYLVSKSWEEFKLQIVKICEKEKVEIIIPGSDIELDHFLEEYEFYEKNCPPILMDRTLARIARDKLLTARTLKSLGFSTPKTWEDLEEVDKYPVVLKPRKGFGSNYLFKDVTSDLIIPLGRYIRNAGHEPIAQEQLIGTEFSCMTLNSKDGELLAVQTARSVKKFGQSYKTIMEKNEELEELVCKMSKALRATGPLSFQLIKTERGYTTFELNARFTGAQIVRAYAGQNGPDILIRNWLTGEKLYPQIKQELVAFWYHDFGYLPLEEFKKVEVEKKIRKRMVHCPKYL